MVVRRHTKASLWVLGTLVLAGAGAGFIQQETVEGAPSYFGIAEPRPGDAGTYATGIVVRSNGTAAFVGDDGRFHFERHGDLLYPNAGAIRALSAYETWWEEAGPYEAVTQWQATFHDAAGETLVEGIPYPEWQGPEKRPSDPVRDQAGDALEGVALVPGDSAGFCGFRNSLQGAERSLVDSIQVQGLCPPPILDDGRNAVASSDGLSLRVAGTDSVHGKPSVVFGWTQDPDAFRAWFQEDVPYPVRLLVRLDAAELPRDPDGTPQNMGAAWAGTGHIYQLYELTTFHRGTGETTSPPPALEKAPWTQTGPDETGVEHPYPLSKAFEGASEEDGPLADFLARSPDAYVADARFLGYGGADAGPWSWVFTVTDGTEAVEVVAFAGENNPSNQVLVDLGLAENPGYTFEETSADGYPTPERVPAEVPAVAGVLRLWDQQTGSDDRDWAFSIRCTDDACTDTEAWIGGGLSRMGGDDSQSGVTQHLVVDGDGRFLYQEELPAITTTHQPDRYEGSAWRPTGWEGSWAYSAQDVHLWNFPQDTAVVVSVGVFAALAGLLYLVWPALKATPLLGLFSRTPTEFLLEHPTRAQIHALLVEEPGLHFQELARRTGQGRGALDHHLRKLAQGGLVTVKVSPGYTCYYPTGQVDRRLMDAAPFLKSDGARRLLEAVVASPGCDVKTIAGRAGLSRSTASYHVRRLVEASLLERTASGTSALLSPTELSEPALAA